MDHVTRATPFSGMISIPKANIWHSLQTQNMMTLVSAVPEIFHVVWNSRMHHAALTTPTWGTVGHLKASTSHGQTVHKIW